MNVHSISHKSATSAASNFTEEIKFIKFSFMQKVNGNKNAWSRFTNKHSENLYIFCTIDASSD